MYRGVRIKYAQFEVPGSMHATPRTDKYRQNRG